MTHGWILQKVYRAIKFIQETWLKPYIDFDTELRTKSKLVLRKSSSS